VYWELTRACDLACRHCRAEAMPDRGADELTTAEAEAVLARLARAPAPRPHVVFTGGDPLKRPDLLPLVRAAVGRGLGVSVAPSATFGITAAAVRDLQAAGVGAMSLSLDGPTAAQHDALRGVLGCFGWTLAAAERIVAAGIPLQVNTLVTADTEPWLDETAKVVARLGAARWSLFFLVGVGRGRALRPLTAIECERRLRWLARTAPSWPFTASTTEAPQYRRVVIQRMRAAGRTPDEIAETGRGWGIRDGNGIMFIAANGDVTPSGFLPLVVGNVRRDDVLRLYREAPLFRVLRTPELFDGRCGACEFHDVCGGSRARAWAATGDALAEDPLCAWQAAGV
jgi:radical SAM protein